MGINSEWEDFAATIPEDAPPREIEIMRRGFYLGAHAMLVTLGEVHGRLSAELALYIGSTENDHLLHEQSKEDQVHED